MKPKYSFFNNARYALDGILAMLRYEMAFRLELLVIIPALILNFFLPLSLLEHLFLAFVLFLILIVEALNSAIESCVDLVTEDFKTKAKIAKDCASAAVFFSVLLALFSWFFVLLGLL